MSKHKAKPAPELKEESPVEAVAQEAQDVAAEAKAPAIPKTRGPRGTDESAVITLLHESNPKRAGSKAEKVFTLYKTGMTIKEFCDSVDAFAKGEGTPNLVYDAKHGYISIDGYDPGAIVEPKVKAPKAVKEPKVKKTKAAPAHRSPDPEVPQTETMS